MIWLIGAVCAALVGSVAYRLRLLTRGGAVTAWVMGWLIFSVGRVALSLPILVFFISSNFWSHLGRNRKKEATALLEKGHQRDYKQVLANGLLPTLLLVGWGLTERPAWVWLFLLAIAAATADTWATEIGLLSKGQPRSILNWQKVPKGSSGGVTWLGMLAAFAGASSIAGLGLIVNQLEVRLHLPAPLLMGLVVFAMFAQLCDSFLGAAWQVKYRCPICGKQTESVRHCTDTVHIAGWPWLDNDWVNFLSIASAVLMGWLWYLFFFKETI